MSLPSQLRYGRMAQTMHWLTAILVLVAFVYGPGGSEQNVYSASRDFERQLHETLGLCVFALTLLRLVWSFATPRPDIASLTAWMRTASKAAQLMLFFLLLTVPLSAVAGAWLEGHPLTLVAGIRIQPGVMPSHELGATIAIVHTWLAEAILWLAGLHALAAIYHHFILRDRVFASMLPQWIYRR